MSEAEEIELEVIAGSEVEFRAKTIYFVVLDRFAAGAPDKPRELDEMFDPCHQDSNKYWGGDLQGVIDKLRVVLARRGTAVEGRTIVRLQVNGAPTQPGDRLLVIGDCEELGRWDLSKGYELERVNANTWFGEIPFNTSTGKAIGYKYVIFRCQPDTPPERENRTVRRRLVIPEGCTKWRDHW